MNVLEWIRVHVRHDTPMGDLARDLYEDTCAVDTRGRPLTTVAALNEHIRTRHDPCSGAIDALSEAGHRYRRGTWWVTCDVCTPHETGQLRQHFTGAKDATARKHLAATANR